MRPTWKPLQIAHKDVLIPPLLIKTEFGLSSYKVWLTDLTHIWIEFMDRRQIIQRAFSVDTSIDPSEDTSQLRLLLQSIEDALVQRAGTSVEVVQSDNRKYLILQTSTPLPGPLNPLEWKIMLMPAPQSMLTTEFVIPLLSQQSTAKAEKASLLQQLKYKDNVISKMIEKMQSDGVDLTRVFPGAPHPRPGANARQIVGKSVNGLGEFDLQHWQNRIARDGKSLEELKDLVSNAFDADSQEPSGESQIQDSPDYGDWWRNLRNENSQQTPATSLLPTSNPEENEIVSGDFQTQLTPLKRQVKLGARKGQGLDLKSIDPSPSRVERLEDDGSTTDDSDFDVQPSKPAKVSPRAGAKLIIGSARARKTAQTPLTAEFEEGGHVEGVALKNKDALSKPKDFSKMYDATSSSDEDAMDVDEDAMVGSKVTSNNKTIDQAPSVPKPKPKLGKIGGKGNAGKRRGSHGAARQSEPPLSVEMQPNGKPNGKEGNVRESIPKTPEIARLGRVTTQFQASSPPRETEQERANKKREQLKRELESKSHAGVKKKRKF